MNEQALRKAFKLGQIYWSQADSESYKQQDKSAETLAQFETLLDEYLKPQLKTLTDEEILALWTEKNNLNGAQDIVDFARAILRKAQEK